MVRWVDPSILRIGFFVSILAIGANGARAQSPTPIVEEVAAKPLPSGYIRYLRLKIRSAAGPHVSEGGKP